MKDLKKYTEGLHHFLQNLGDETIANKQAQYMRNQFPFYGLMKEKQDKYWTEYQLENGKINAEDVIEFCKFCIQYSEREIWYIGLKMLIKHKKKLKAEDLSFVQKLIVKGNWWDIVDGAASHLVGTLVQNYPSLAIEVNQWIDSDNFWLRRTAIIYQLSYKKKTNENTLYTHILKTCHESEFFIRKAIGWALREYSKHNPESVRNFIAIHRDKLSPLSIREGSKYI